MAITTPTKLGDKLDAFTKVVESGSVKRKKKKGRKKGGELKSQIESQIVSEMKEAVDRDEGGDIDLKATGDGDVGAKKSRKRKRGSGGTEELKIWGGEDSKAEETEGKQRKKKNKKRKRESIKNGFGAAEENGAESVIVKVEGEEGTIAKSDGGQQSVVGKESQDTMDIIMAHNGTNNELEAKLSKREKKKAKQAEKAAKKEKEKAEAAEEALVNETISSFMEDTGDEAGDELDTEAPKSPEREVVQHKSSKKTKEKSEEGAKQTPTVIKETRILPPSSAKSAPAATPTSNTKTARILPPGVKQPTSSTKIVPSTSRNTPASASKSTKPNLQVAIPAPTSVSKSTRKIAPPSPNTLSREITRRLEAVNESESGSETNPVPPIASKNKGQKKDPSNTESKAIHKTKPKVGSVTPKEGDEQEKSFSQVIEAVKNLTSKVWPVNDLKEKKQRPILPPSKSGRDASGSNSTSASSFDSDVFTSSANKQRGLSVTNKGSPVKGGPAPKMGDLGTKAKSGKSKGKDEKKDEKKGKDWGHLWQREFSTGRIRGPAVVEREGNEDAEGEVIESTFLVPYPIPMFSI